MGEEEEQDRRSPNRPSVVGGPKNASKTTTAEGTIGRNVPHIACTGRKFAPRRGRLNHYVP
jgi:hypothetical protein